MTDYFFDRIISQPKLMKDAVTVLLLLVILFLVWNGRQTATYDQESPSEERVSPDVTQVILEKVQSMNPDFQPLETLFINHQGDDVYAARFMFIDTKHYYGTQYDVQARVNQNGSVDILNLTGTATADYSNAYKPDRYESWTTIQNSLDDQLKQALNSKVEVPPLESYRY